jgi:hypothetical protein
MAEQYFVEGADGALHGPADVDKLREWVAQDRVLEDTVLVDSEKRRLYAKDVPGLFGGAVSDEPPPVRRQPPVEAPPVSGQFAGAYAEPPRKQGLPVWAIVLICIAGLCGLGVPILAALLFPVFAQAKWSAKKVQTLSNMKQLSLAMIMYTTDFDDKFPPTMDSALAVKPFVEAYAKNDGIFLSLHPEGSELLGNGKLAGKASQNILRPADTLMFYDEKPWQDKLLAAYTDGHVDSNSDATRLQSLLDADPFH